MNKNKIPCRPRTRNLKSLKSNLMTKGAGSDFKNDVSTSERHQNELGQFRRSGKVKETSMDDSKLNEVIRICIPAHIL